MLSWQLAADVLSGSHQAEFTTLYKAATFLGADTTPFLQQLFRILQVCCPKPAVTTNAVGKRHIAPSCHNQARSPSKASNCGHKGKGEADPQTMPSRNLLWWEKALVQQHNSQNEQRHSVYFLKTGRITYHTTSRPRSFT